MSQGERDFMPALRFRALTRLFDPIVATYAREGAFKRRLLRHADLRAGERVLDLGCGTGTLALMASETAPGIEIEGLDADREVLRSARAKADDAGCPIRFREGMATDLPYDDERFDVVLSTLFFHHLEDAAKRATAAEVARVLKPGGRVIVGDIGRPQDPLMRVAVAATVQLLDGPTTTRLNVAGGLASVFAYAGLDTAVVDRLRTPVGTLETLAGCKDA
jgi:ubiquinone/menaquinone biosynthesis C-methylase UbiE